MSDRPILRLKDLGRMGLIATSLVGSLAFGGGSIVRAQDATPAASPAGDCTPNAGISEATPAAATPEASPVAAEAPVGTPADDATTAEVQAFIANIQACIGDEAALQTLITPNLALTLGGYASIEEAAADGFLTDLPFGDADVSHIQSYDDGSVSANMQYMQSEYQLVSEKWMIIDVDGEWKLNAITEGDLPDLDGDQAAVGVNLLENGDGTYSIAPNAESVVATDILILQGINPDTNSEAHELVVIKLPEGADPMGLFDGTVSQDDIEFIGAVTAGEPGSSADMYLLGLPAGKYTLLCFFPSADGSPHAAHGMMAPFEVTAPAE
jgi:hypothetical protein